ncbi:unnamed protein product [Rodentolepis nana]|uniref:Flocculation protein FLO11-like n=1 Tax=Rodentolepis nana TaxID=102285 RepID=A0A158QJD2_RODNA|nr:unnamed protein product [Rodentolepis nana]
MSDRKRMIMSRVHTGDPLSPLSKKRKRIPGPLSMLSKSDLSSKNAPRRKTATSSSNESANLSLSVCDISSTQVDAIWDRVARLFCPESWKIFTDYSIAKIVKSAEKGFPRGKIPVLCASVEKIDMVLPIAKAVLQDETGKIGCSIDKSVINKYKKFFTIGAVLVLKQISLFSLNQKTFYLNITPSNVIQIFLDEAAFDSRLLASARALEDVSVCGPSFPLTHPPLSLKELKDLVAECFSPPSPPAPSSPSIVRPTYPLKPTVAPRSNVKSLNITTPKKAKCSSSRHNTSKNSPSLQADRNWRLNSSPKTAAVKSEVSSPSTPSFSLPPQSRFGIRSILKKTLCTTPTTPNSPVLMASNLDSGGEKPDFYKGEFVD